ncbi:hypothetical protein BN1221_03033c [Brenneria goodwinii]|uniref:Uncharacterized protein n=1 Tax=Brenneria goodwinii TaxID=1109412 RepID=A0A0G4JXB1_9GAMM|nr:hypothetical protein BN1221_03033c [Brenneria goodwinii]
MQKKRTERQDILIKKCDNIIKNHIYNMQIITFITISR